MTTDVELTERLRAWSYRRQRLDRTGGDLLQTIGDLAAIYGTQPTAPLTVMARTNGMDAASFARLEDEKRVVRLPAMRGSLHLMPVDTAPAIYSAFPLPTGHMKRALQTAGLDLDDYERAKPRLLDLLREPVEANGIKKRLGISDGDFVVIRTMMREALVLRLATTPRTDRLRYVATDAWLGKPLATMDQQEALAWLAGAYFRAFGPARLADFAWWTSASKRRAQEVLARLDLVDVGEGLLLPVEDREAFARVEALDADAIALLPKWDAYAMGYAPDGRQRFVDDTDLPYAYSTSDTKVGATSGDGLPIVLRGGRAVAGWSHRFSGKKMEIAVTPFPDEEIAQPEVEERFEEIAQLMESPDVRLTIATH